VLYSSVDYLVAQQSAALLRRCSIVQKGAAKLRRVHGVYTYRLPAFLPPACLVRIYPPENVYPSDAWLTASTSNCLPPVWMSASFVCQPHSFLQHDGHPPASWRPECLSLFFLPANYLPAVCPLCCFYMPPFCITFFCVFCLPPSHPTTVYLLSVCLPVICLNACSGVSANLDAFLMNQVLEY
jgi:hypothetical protein